MTEQDATMNHDCISRGYLLGIANRDDAYGYVSAHDIINAPCYSLQEPKTEWIPVSEGLPELNKPLLVTSYHRVYYGHLISESGNYGYPVFRIHGLGDKNRDWVQETMSHEPYSLGRIDAWMYLTIPEPYKESEVK